MPLYEYACRGCGAAFERRRKFEERQAEALCPVCGAAAAPVLSAPALVGGGAGASAPPACDTGPACCGGGTCGPN